MDLPPYPAACRLYLIAEERWAEIDAFYNPTEILRLRDHRFLNFVYAWCVGQINPEKREEWDMMLLEPMPGQQKKVPSPVAAEGEGDMFMQMIEMNKQVTGS